MTVSEIFPYLCPVWLTTIWKNGTTNTFSAKLLLKRQNERHGKNAWMHTAGNSQQSRKANPEHPHPSLPSHNQLLPLAIAPRTSRLERPAIPTPPSHKRPHADNLHPLISNRHPIPNRLPSPAPATHSRLILSSTLAVLLQQPMYPRTPSRCIPPSTFLHNGSFPLLLLYLPPQVNRCNLCNHLCSSALPKIA